MPESTLSTQEVATLINVTETTIKRWADEGKLRCTRTPGGHRKFMMKDVLAFAETNDYALTGTLPPPMNSEQMEQLQFGVYTRNYKRVSEVFLEEVLQADREGIYTLLLYLCRHHISFSAIADEVIRPALVRIGELWQDHQIDINREHKASHAVTEALVRLAPEIRHKEKNGMSVVCACPEGEYHEIGLRSLAYALEIEGWTLHYLGANTPLETLTDFIKSSKPRLVCLSFSIASHRPKFLDGLKSFGKAIHAYGGKFLVGGFNVGAYTEAELGCDHITPSVTEAISYVRDIFQLKPGPKTSGWRNDE